MKRGPTRCDAHTFLLYIYKTHLIKTKSERNGKKANKKKTTRASKIKHPFVLCMFRFSVRKKIKIEKRLENRK